MEDDNKKGRGKGMRGEFGLMEAKERE